MKKRVLFCLMVSLSLLLPVTVFGSSWQFPWSTITGKQSKVSPVYWHYFYNYRQMIPADYVFRSSRLFTYIETKKNLTNQYKLGGQLGVQSGAGIDLNNKIHLLGQQLLDNASEAIPDNYTLTISTFVNLHQLYSTSSLGRHISEQLISELQQAGVNIIEVRKTPGIMIRKGYGEYGLSRDMDKLSFVHRAHAMVVGTYTLTDQEILVNARVLDNDQGAVLSTASLVFDINSVTQKLLRDEGMPRNSIKPLKLRSLR